MTVFGKSASLLALLLVLTLTTWAVPEPSAQLGFFESKIRPVLIQHCYKCHSADSGKSKGGLRLDSRTAWQHGGESGPALVPGHPDRSLIIKAISRSGEIPEMPPKSHLPDQVINDFKQWIADGAMDPREGEAPVHEEETIDIEAGRKHWAFQSRKRASQIRSIDELANPQSTLAPAETLVRRLFLDLIGLPPTTDEHAEFLSLYEAKSPNHAVKAFAERLLARRAFGEKWARHWLDIARYADSNGGDFNLTFPEAWRYRNYVIDAFNEDMPYDQFLREQIAGDLLPYESAAQRNRQLIATGFLMVAPKMLTERNKSKMHLDIADEQVDTVGRAVMGLTLGCARCHDHKFDPIPTEDYYALAGIFHSTRTADGILMNNVNVTGWTETPLEEEGHDRERSAEGRRQIQIIEEQIEKFRGRVEQRTPLGSWVAVDDTEAKKTGPWRESTFRSNHVGDHYLAADRNKGPFSITWKTPVPTPGEYEVRVSFGGGNGLTKKAPYVIRHADGQTFLTIDQTQAPSIRQLWFPLGRFTFDTEASVELALEQVEAPVVADAVQLVHVNDLENEASWATSPIHAEIKALQEKLRDLKSTPPEVPKAMATADHANERFGDLHIRVRGETENLGPLVPRGFLQVATEKGDARVDIPNGESGRRQLADWLTHPNHPLTARVMANRVWQQLFGKGIVQTSDNFGLLGAAPSNPDLLDYLAERLLASEWSVKSLIREIVSSKTYQQSVPAESPGSPSSLHRTRRPAPAETLRDSILAIAGQLDGEPRQSVVAHLGMYAIATSGKRDPSLAETGKLRQRSIYLPIVRGAVPPSLAVFDLPNPDLVTGARPITTVPAQALFMMNSDFVRAMAHAVAQKATDETTSVDQLIQTLYLQILSREADASDLTLALAYIEQLLKAGKPKLEAVASFAQVLFCSTEFRFID